MTLEPPPRNLDRREELSATLNGICNQCRGAAATRGAEAARTSAAHRQRGQSVFPAAGLAAALVLTLMASGRVAAQDRPPTAREIPGLIDELAALPRPTQQRADAIASSLALVEPAKSFSPLRDAASIEGKRAAAAWLVAKTRHPKAWDILGKYVTSADYDVVVDSLVECGGDVVERELRNRWAAEAVDSTLYAYLVSKLAKARLNAESVAFFVGKIGDEKNGADARTIARAALKLDSNAGDAQMLEANASFQQTAALFCRRWTTKGTVVPLQGGEAWGDNRQFGPEAHLCTPLPEWTKSKNHILVVRFIPLSDDNCEVGYESTQGIWSVNMQRGVGKVVAGDQVEYPTTARVKAWCEIKFDVKVKDLPGQVEKDREITITVDGKVLMRGFAFNGDIKGVLIHGASVVGACELMQG